MAKDKSTKKTQSTLNEVISKEYTIHLHKHVYGQTFKKRAPKAIKVIREFAQKQMKTKDVRLDTGLNKAVWARGIKTVPHRIRVRLSRKRNDTDDADEKLYTFVEHIEMTTREMKGLSTITVE